MGLINLVVTFVMAILFAILLNEIRQRRTKKVIQTVSYLPHFLSWIIVTGILHDALSGTGIVNELLKNFHLTEHSVDFFAHTSYFWPIVAFANVWKETGWNAIIYLSAITAIDPSLYEAAKVDGASTWRTYWKIIFPIMRPMHATVAVLTALAVWNDVMTPLIIMAGSGQNTLPLAQLNFQSQFGTNYNLAFASYLLSLVPILIFYIVCQKQILNGVVNGAVK